MFVCMCVSLQEKLRSMKRAARTVMKLAVSATTHRSAPRTCRLIRSTAADLQEPAHASVRYPKVKIYFKVLHLPVYPCSLSKWRFYSWGPFCCESIDVLLLRSGGKCLHENIQMKELMIIRSSGVNFHASYFWCFFIRVC